eukprot:2733671-Rhodomonas_salina.2
MVPNEYRVDGTVPALGAERSVHVAVAMSYACRSWRREDTAHTHHNFFSLMDRGSGGWLEVQGRCRRGVAQGASSQQDSHALTLPPDTDSH